MPWWSKITDANLIEWINVMIRNLCASLLLLLIYKDEIIYSMYYVKQILKLYFCIPPITKNRQNQVNSNNWKYLITSDFQNCWEGWFVQELSWLNSKFSTWTVEKNLRSFKNWDRQFLSTICLSYHVSKI